MVPIQKLPEKNFSYAIGRTSRRFYFTGAVVAFVLFVVTVIAASGGAIARWEHTVFMSINNVQSIGAITTLARIMSDAVWVAVVVVALLFLWKKYFWAAWRIAVPAVAAYATVFITGHLVGRARPDIVLPGDTVVRAIQSGVGFPSGHVATLTAIVGALWPFLSWPWKAAGITAVVLEAWSRIYLGVHFPLDIIGGFAVGLGVVCVLRMLPGIIREKFYLV